MTNRVEEKISKVGRTNRIPSQILKRKSLDTTPLLECGHDDQQCWHHCVGCRKDWWHPVSKGGLVDRFFKLCSTCQAAGNTARTWKPG